MSALRRRGHTVRDQLTLLVTAVLLAGGVGVIAIQYGVLASVLHGAARAVTEVSSGGPGPVGAPGGAPAQIPPDAQRLDDAAFGQSVGGLSDAVLGRMLVSSFILVVLVVLLAALASRWLVGRLLRRVREVTDQARQVSAGDLSRRLSLPGPQDEITELGDTFDAMLARLEVVFEQHQRFVANASHELRTPLAANRLALEGPLAQGRFSADVEPDVLRALEANHKSARLLEALLQLARLPDEVPDPRPVDLTALVDDVVERLRPGARARGVRLSFAVGRPEIVHGNATLLAQAVGNLVENSVKYAPSGADTTVAITPSAGGVVLRVENPGPVFTGDEAEQLREAFHRGPRVRQSPSGSGLGLTLVDSIARAHGGALHLTPRAGGGLVAEVFLPGAERSPD